METEHTKHLLLDMRNAQAEGTAAAKVSEQGARRFVVQSFDQVSMTAKVLPLGGWETHPMTVRVGVHENGTIPGTGSAHGLKKGDHVDVLFPGGDAGSRFNNGIITHVWYTPKQNVAPAYAPWHQDGTGSVHVAATPEGTPGTARHEDAHGNVSETNFGRRNSEHWGNEHHVANGQNIPRAEVQIREAGAIITKAVAKLRARG